MQCGEVAGQNQLKIYAQLCICLTFTCTDIICLSDWLPNTRSKSEAAQAPNKSEHQIFFRACSFRSLSFHELGD